MTILVTVMMVIHMSKPRLRPHTKPSGGSVRRVVTVFPENLFVLTERVAAELSTTRSELIRRAVEQYLETLGKSALERELAEGYIANAAQARQACEDFARP